MPTRNHVGRRKGYRVLSAGEKPFLAPNSMGREEWMAAQKAEKEQAEVSGDSGKGVATNGAVTDGAATNGISAMGVTRNGIAVH